MPEDDIKTMEQYKIVRKSIEHFDKLLSDLRKIVWGFNGTIAAVIVYHGRTIIKPDSSSFLTDKTKVKILILGSLLFTLTNILIWAVEKHYHRYLTMSAKVSEEIEKKLFKNTKMQLTYRLREIRDYGFYDEAIPKVISNIMSKISTYVRSYDFIYLFPIIASEFLNIYLAYKLKNLDYLIMSSMMFLFSIGASYIIVQRSYCVTNRYDLKDDQEK